MGIQAIKAAGQGVSIAVAVVPRAGRDELVGFEGDAIKIRLKAAPVEGRANEALLAFLAKRLDVPRSALEMLSGSAGRRKAIRVKGLTVEEVARRLGI